VGRGLFVLLPAAAILELLAFGLRFVKTMPETDLLGEYKPSSAIALLKEARDEWRVLIADDVIAWQTKHLHPELYPNRLMMHGVRTVRGYDSTILADYSRFVNRIQGRNEEESPGGLLKLTNPVSVEDLQRLNVRFVVTYNQMEHLSGPAFVGENGLTVYEVPSAMSWIAGEGERGLERLEALEKLAWSGDEFVFRVELAEERRLVWSDVYAPGWRAEVDDRPVTIRQAEGCFKGVIVPAGEHTVRFWYRPPGLWLGMGLAGLGLVILAGAAVVRSRRAEESRPAPPHAGGGRGGRV